MRIPYHGRAQPGGRTPYRRRLRLRLPLLLRRRLRLQLRLRLAYAAGVAVAIGLAVAVGSIVGTASIPPVHGQAINIERDLVYYEGPGAVRDRQSVDLYMPSGDASVPWVVFLHGGGWTSGDKTDAENIGQSLANRGIATALVNTRLSEGGPTGVMHPRHAEDAARAISFVRAQLIHRGLSPTDMFLMGHESGAHLAALLATNARFLAQYGLALSDIRGVIGLCGTYIVQPTAQTQTAIFGTDPDLRRDASPMHQVTNASPPFLLIYGTSDASSVGNAARNFADKLDSFGVSNILKGEAGRDVGTIATSFGELGDPVIADVTAFITGRLRPTPTATATPLRTATPTPTATPANVAPPTQPATGPGGSDQPHAGVRVIPPDPDQGTEPGSPPRYFLFEPQDPTPQTAPVLVFLGAEGDSGPDAYRTWINHTARNGVVVIYLSYSLDSLVAVGTPTPAPAADGPSWTRYVASGVLAALAKLDTDGHVHPSREATFYAGHGLGAVLVADLAADWFNLHLPVPRGLLLATPRNSPAILAADLSRVPRDTHILFVSGQEALPRDLDTEVAIWQRLAELPGVWRERVTLTTDRHGTPPLIADFDAPRTGGTRGRTDALDWYGTWKWLDALISCTLRRADCAYAFGNTSAQRFMGRWADGVPVREAGWSAGPVGGAVGRVGYLPWVRRR